MPDNSATSVNAIASNRRRPSKPLDLMNDEERLESIREWAEEKKYVRPGEAGTLPASTLGSMNALAFGGPLQTAGDRSSATDRYAAQCEVVGPPSYGMATGGPAETATHLANPLARWLAKRRRKKAAERQGDLPEYRR